MSKLGEFRRRRFAACTFGALTFLLVASAASAQTAGKVEGTVNDADTGEPLVGAQVLVEGTQLGNIADDNGYYFINNVPLGAQTVTATFLGYQSESGQYRILSGQTTTADFSLSTEVIVADSAIITVTEREPLVPRDNTISKSRFIKENVEDLPLTSIEDLVTLAAGASEQQGGISLRGARPDDATVYVDGINATDFSDVSNSGINTQTVSAGGERTPIEFGQFSIEQIDVVTGGADASFGDAQSGVVNVVTGRGGADLSGNVRFTTDAMNIERSDDFYEIQGNVGGPLLGDGRASFFLSGSIRGSRQTSDSFGFDPRFEDVVAVGDRLGLDISREAFCDGDTCFTPHPNLPLLNIDNFVQQYLQANAPEFLEENEYYFTGGDGDNYPGITGDRYTFAGKLAFTPTQTTDVQLSYTRNRDQAGPGGFAATGQAGISSVFNPFNSQSTTETVDFGVLSLRQIFYQEADRSLAVDARVAYFDDKFRAGNLYDPTCGAATATFTPPARCEGENLFPLLDGNQGGDDFLNFRFSDFEYFGDRAGDLGASFGGSIDDLIEEYENQFDNSNAHEDLNFIRDALTVGPVIPSVPNLSEGGPDIFGIGAFTGGPFPLPTVDFPRGDVRQLDQIIANREKRLNVRADVDAQISRINRLQGGVDLKFFDVRKFSQFLSSRLFNSQYFVEPRLFGIYATNRIDLGDFVLDLGGRFDYFDHNTELPELAGGASNDIDGDGSTLTEYDTQTAFAPRLGVAHPVTEQTQVRFSYGVFNQLPSFDELYRNVTGDIRIGDLNANSVVGNPELDFQQTRSFELGITHLISEDVVFDVVAYNRDIDRGTAARLVNEPQIGGIRKYFNVNNGNVRGLDLTMTKRFSNLWSADVTYSYLDSKVTDSDQDAFAGNQGFNTTAEDPIDAPTAPLPADYDVTHKLASTFSLRFPNDFADNTTVGAIFQNFGVFATSRFSSGLPYTRQPIGAAGVFIEPTNSSRRDSEFQTDVRATKYFELTSGIELGAIFEVFNLFNNENLLTFQQRSFLDSGINNGVWNSTGNRFLEGVEIRDAESRIEDDVIIRDIPGEGTPGGDLTREFRSFSDIDNNGTVTRGEQRIMGILAYGAASEVYAQPKRSYRLGVEFRF